MKEANSDVCFGLRGFSAYRQEDEHAQYVEAYGGHVVVDELPGADVRSEPRVIHCPAKDEADRAKVDKEIQATINGEANTAKPTNSSQAKTKDNCCTLL